jgi:peptidoglycan-associated lipoprotein
MKRQGWKFFIAALVILPLIIGLNSCAKQAVKTEAVKPPAQAAVAPKPSDDEAKKREAERLAREKEAEAAKQKAEEAALMAKMKADADAMAAKTKADMRNYFLRMNANFDFDKYNIRPDAEIVLKEKADYMKMKGNEKIKVEIQGHCDERGTEDYNMALGDRRAKAAEKYMYSLGIGADRMTTISYGKDRPLDPAHNEEAWAKNRRAQFVITSE